MQNKNKKQVQIDKVMNFNFRKQLCDATIKDLQYESWMFTSHIQFASAPMYTGEMIRCNDDDVQKAIQYANRANRKTNQLLLKAKKELQSKTFVRLHNKTLDKLSSKEQSDIWQINCCGADKLTTFQLWRYAVEDNIDGKTLWVSVGRDGLTNSIKKAVQIDIKQNELANSNSVLFATMDKNNNILHDDWKHNDNYKQIKDSGGDHDEKKDDSKEEKLNGVDANVKAKVNVKKEQDYQSGNINNSNVDSSDDNYSGWSFLFIENECKPVSSTEIRKSLVKLETCLNDIQASDEQRKQAKEEFVKETKDQLSPSTARLLCRMVSNGASKDMYYVKIR